jgi:hypothetical protein
MDHDDSLHDVWLRREILRIVKTITIIISHTTPANNPPNMRILSAGRRREKEHCSRVVNEKILNSTANELLVKNERK